MPQISAIMGPCAGGAVYSPAITDFTVMVRETSYMFITGPDVIKTVTHEEVTKENLGGAMTHNRVSGVAHFAADDDKGALATIKKLLSYIPSNNLEDPPRVAVDRSAEPPGEVARQHRPGHLQPALRHQEGDRPASWTTGSFFEVHEHYAKNIVVGFARLAGQSRRHRRQPARAPRRRAWTSTPP